MSAPPGTSPDALVATLPSTPPATPAARHEYLGHPQPEIDQRLLQSKNFLADEDPDRYLHFEDKIREIEEYIAFLEKPNSPKPNDPKLLQDVKTMVAAHRDWEKRQKEFSGPIPTICCDPDAPTIQPYSNRLVSTETARMIEDEKAAIGLAGQVREDRAVFSHDCGPDHYEFLKKMREEVAQDPVDIDTDTNLAWIESRAYGWAVNDPALISHWMHPTRGIPNKPLSLLDGAPWYKDPKRALSLQARKKPARTWLPQYLKKREDRINELLSLSSHTVGQWEELEKLLHFHEPLWLMTDHDAVLQLAVLRDWGYPVTEDALNQASDHFEERFAKWVTEFPVDGVQLMLYPRGSAAIQSDEPGVFYVEDGMLDEDRENVIKQADALLVKYKSGGSKAFSNDEMTAFNSLLDHSTPLSIVQLQQQKCGIVQRYQSAQTTPKEAARDVDLMSLNRQIEVLRRARRKALKNSTETFRHIKPGEMLDPDNDDLYLPWDRTRVTAIPDLLPQWPAVQPTASIASIQDAINQGFQKGLETGLEDGNTTFVLLLHQVAYPELRVLLIPFLHLCWKETQQVHSNQKTAIMNILRPIVHELWNAWIHGFTVRPGVKRVTVVMPGISQKPKRPDFIYCRSKDPNHDSKTCKANMAAINALIKRGITTLSDVQRADHFNQLSRLFPQEHRYPALSTSNVNNGLTPTAKEINDMFLFDQWMISKSNYTLSMHKYNEYSDPNDDPTFVYYHGPLPTLSDLKARLSKSRSDEIKFSQPVQESRVNLPTNFDYLSKMSSELHEVLQDQLSQTWPGERPSRINTLMSWFVHEVQNLRSEAPLVISDYLPRGRINDGEDGIDDTDVIIHKDIKHLAKVQQEVMQVARKRKVSPPFIPAPPKEHSRDLIAAPEDIYAVSKNGTYLVVSLSKIIMSIEVELNRILHILNEPTCNTSVHALQDTTVDAIRARLYRLLPQFMPARIYGKWTHYRTFMDAHNQNQGPPTKKETLEKLQLEDEYSNEVVPWLRSLTGVARPGISIIVPDGSNDPDEGPGRIYHGDRDVKDLYFQERTFEKVGTKDVTLRINAPDVEQDSYKDADAIGQADIVEFSLVKFDMNNMPPPAPLPQQLSWDLDDLEREINQLLKRRDKISWEDSERLIECLRIIMPVDMVDQDEYLLAIDNAARRDLDLTPEETVEFWDLWSQWDLDYGTWLGNLPETICIDRGSVNDAKRAKSSRFAPNSQALYPPRVKRDHSLPHPVVEIVNDLTNVLQDPASSSLDLAESTWVFLRTVLRPFHRQIAQDLRALLEARIKNDLCLASPTASKSEAVLDAEDKVLIEVTIDIAYVNFICAMLQASSPNSTSIRVEEELPGKFEIKYVGRKPLHELSPSAQEIFDILWLKKHQSPERNLMEHKKRFHKLADRIRNDVALTPTEVLFVQDQLQPLPRYRGMMVDLSNFVDVMKNGEELTDPDRLEYTELETSLLWHRWFYDYQNLAEKVGTRQRVIDPVDDLMSRRLAGTTRDPPGPPLISPPNQVEITEVEIEINNLLVKDRNNTAVKNERRELDYLLTALLPPRLRKWKYLLDYQEKRYLIQGGLEARDTLEFLARERKFKQNFDRFKAHLPKHGIILSFNWCSFAAICEVCSRARTWKDHTRNPDGSYNYPMTNNFIEDFNLRTWRQQHILLENRVDATWMGNKDLQKLFLWDFMPQELRDLKQSLEDPAKRPSFNDPFSDQTHPLLRKSQFMHQYMCWLSGFSPAKIEEMRGQAGDYKGRYDFTPKAERRGVQRASVELALNHLATNQEQHRPGDRFRVVDISGQPFHKPEKEVPICLPLESWKRPLEQDPFGYTKKLAIYRQWKDEDYHLARERTADQQIQTIETPANYLGPFALADGDTFKEGSRKLQARLACIALIMQEAQLKAPRPLMQHLLSRFSEGLNADNYKRNGEKHPLADDQVALRKEDLDLLVELSGDSWDEIKQDIPEKFFDSFTPETRTRFEELVRDIEALADLIPAWIPPPAGRIHLDLDDVDQFVQPQHDPAFRPYTQGISVIRLMLILNERRQSHDPPLTPWTRRQIYQALHAMNNALRLYFHGIPRDGRGALPEDNQRVWRIPLTGHPENKYVLTPATDPNNPAPGVKFIKNAGLKTGLAVVRYDANGAEGPPIEQPKKFKHFQKLAYRLGRDSRLCLKTATADYLPTRICLDEQRLNVRDTLAAMSNVTTADRLRRNPSAENWKPDKYTLKNLALDIHIVAPDLAYEAEIDFPNNNPEEMEDSQAAKILQMQIIEEVSNNWELRFPENEHVWDFAKYRLKEIDRNIGTRTIKMKPRNKRFFNLRRFPVSCQSKELQALIVKSGPVVQEKSMPAELSRPLTRAELRAQAVANLKPPPKKDRHIRGQRPSFPFGETPYQAAFQSFRMEQDLKDVPEFQPPKKPMSFMPSIFRRKRKHDGDDDAPAPKRFGLPSLPEDWEPDNISRATKTAQMIEITKRTPGMPDPSILEHYYTQAEIEGLNRQEAWDIHCQRVEIANQAIENLTGKMFRDLTPAELNQARMDLDIDLTLGTMNNVPDPKSIQIRGTARPLPVASGTASSSAMTGPGGAPTPGGFAARRAARASIPINIPTLMNPLPMPQQTGQKSTRSPTGSASGQTPPTRQAGALPEVAPGVPLTQEQFDALVAQGKDPWQTYPPATPPMGQGEGMGKPPMTPPTGVKKRDPTAPSGKAIPSVGMGMGSGARERGRMPVKNIVGEEQEGLERPMVENSRRSPRKRGADGEGADKQGGSGKKARK